MREPEAPEREKHERNNHQDQSYIDHDENPPALMIALRAVFGILPPAPGRRDVRELAPPLAVAFAVVSAKLEQEPEQDAGGQHGDAELRAHKVNRGRAAGCLRGPIKFSFLFPFERITGDVNIREPATLAL